MTNYDELRVLAEAVEQGGGWYENNEHTYIDTTNPQDVAFIAAFDPTTAIALLDRVAELEAVTAYLLADSPAICPRCGGWDGPQLPFCAHDGFTHAETCARYVWAADLCPTCETAVANEWSHDD